MDNISKVYELMRNNDVQNNYDIHKSAYENNFVRLITLLFCFSFVYSYLYSSTSSATIKSL